MIDLHCHILPGVDDGARNLEEAAAMCRAAAAAGCEAMVATPHQRRGEWWNCDRGSLALLSELRQRLQEAVGPVPRILPGGEIRVDSDLLGEIAALRPRPAPAGGAGAAAGPPAAPAVQSVAGPLPLAGSRYLLLEFGPAAAAPAAADLVHELSVAGWRPVLAHPELIAWMTEDPAIVPHLVSLGALCQLTAMSITGDFGRRAQAESHRLIDRGLAHFVASDAHDLRRRPPGLARAWKSVAERWGEEAARELMDGNPRAVVADLPLSAAMAEIGATAETSATGAAAGAAPSSR